MHLSPGAAFLLFILVLIAALVLQAVLRRRAYRLRPAVLHPLPSEIITAIRQAPVLEQPRAKKAYHGLKVRWPVTFESALPGPGMLSLICREQGDLPAPQLVFDVRKHKYPQLNGLREQTPLWVTGQISKIDFIEMITLKNAILEFEA